MPPGSRAESENKPILSLFSFFFGYAELPVTILQLAGGAAVIVLVGAAAGLIVKRRRT